MKQHLPTIAYLNINILKIAATIISTSKNCDCCAKKSKTKCSQIIHYIYASFECIIHLLFSLKSKYIIYHIREIIQNVCVHKIVISDVCLSYLCIKYAIACLDNATKERKVLIVKHNLPLYVVLNTLMQKYVNNKTMVLYDMILYLDSQL